MKNPFSPANQGEMNLKRNAYDLSNSSIFSTEFGRLTPSFLQEVIPGDSFQIDGSLAIQGMPTVFPLQTRCRASVEFYYCRNRCVHDNFEDFIFQTKDIEHPWLRMNTERAKQMISTGSLGDMFGLPTTYVSDSPVVVRPYFAMHHFYCSSSEADPFNFPHSVENVSLYLDYIKQHSYSVLNVGPMNPSNPCNIGYGYFLRLLDFPLNNSFSSDEVSTTLEVLPDSVDAIIFFTDSSGVPISSAYSCVVSGDLETLKCRVSVDSSVDLHSLTNDFLERYGSYNVYISSKLDSRVTVDNVTFYRMVDNPPYFPFVPSSSYFVPSGFVFTLVTSGIVDATSDAVISANPFVGTTPSIKVNALPFRHYEMICNYYYRNDKNNPYYLNGEPQYNEFIPTHADGADDNVYDYHYRNWELDRFTSAVQSPQFGEAPLVGLTFNGADTAQLTFQDANDATKTYTATVGLDGDRVATVEDFSTDIPSANLRKLTDGISYGISINDLRVTNSFQRFLENTLRRGLRYRNQLKSHFGVSVDYPDIDIPQYIGGFSGELTVGKNTQMASTSEAPLGDFNGSLSGLLQSKHKIHCYCPEHGYIIGIVSISPMPVYTQVANKSLIKYSPFDYYLPEFGKIGFVPIHYSEVMPLQTPAGGSVDDVFGYQKAHYDYMQNFDSAHGYFRTNLKDFLLQRVFHERPDLVSDFTVINPDQLTDVFVTRNIDDGYNMRDKFLCNLHVNCIAKRVIPRVGTPSLE